MVRPGMPDHTLTLGGYWIPSPDGSLISDLAWHEATLIFSVRKSLRPRTNYVLSGTNKHEEQIMIKLSLDFIKYSLI
jgi:hypothetical protein